MDKATATTKNQQNKLIKFLKKPNNNPYALDEHIRKFLKTTNNPRNKKSKLLREITEQKENYIYIKTDKTFCFNIFILLFTLLLLFSFCLKASDGNCYWKEASTEL